MLTRQGNLAEITKHASGAADVNTKNDGGDALLYIAAQNGHLDVVRFLGEEGADIDVKNEGGRTPLYAAARNGHLGVVLHLHEKGANIDAANKDGCTPLYAAAEKGHLDVVRLLHENGADTEAKTKGISRYSVLTVVRAPDRLSVRLQHGRTPLFAAARNGHLDVVRLLQEKGADMEAKTKYGWTPLYAAAFNGHLDVVRLLHEKGADMEARTKDGWKPLYAAAEKGHLDVVRLLHEKGADTEAKRSYVDSGKSALDYAKQFDKQELVQYLEQDQVDRGVSRSLKRSREDDASQADKRTCGGAGRSSSHEVVKEFTPLEIELSLSLLLYQSTRFTIQTSSQSRNSPNCSNGSANMCEGMPECNLGSEIVVSVYVWDDSRKVVNFEHLLEHTMYVHKCVTSEKQVLASRARLFVDNEMVNAVFTVKENEPQISGSDKICARCTYKPACSGKCVVSVKMELTDAQLHPVDGDKHVLVKDPYPCLSRSEVTLRIRDVKSGEIITDLKTGGGNELVVVGQRVVLCFSVEKVYGRDGLLLEYNSERTRMDVMHELNNGMQLTIPSTVPGNDEIPASPVVFIDKEGSFCFESAHVFTQVADCVLLKLEQKIPGTESSEVKVFRVCVTPGKPQEIRSIDSDGMAVSNFVYESDSSSPLIIKVEILNQFLFPIERQLVLSAYFKGEGRVRGKPFESEIKNLIIEKRVRTNNTAFYLVHVPLACDAGYYSLTSDLECLPKIFLRVYTSDNTRKFSVDDVNLFFLENATTHELSASLKEDFDLNMTGQEVLASLMDDIFDKVMQFAKYPNRDARSLLACCRKVRKGMLDKDIIAQISSGSLRIPGIKNIPKFELNQSPVAIGYGSSCKVFKGVWNKGPDGVAVDVAIKIPKMPILQKEEQKNMLDALKKEIQQLSGVTSDHIVHLYGVSVGHQSGLDAFQYGLVMELCNFNLTYKISEDGEKGTVPLKARDVSEMALQVVLGISHLHRHKIVHGDVKSDNFLIKHDNSPLGFTVKIADFGLSHVARDTITFGGSKLSRDVMGTFSFMAPEAFQEVGKEAEVSGKQMDMWGVGCVLYHMMEGKPPWEGLAQCKVVQELTIHRHCPELSKMREQEYPKDLVNVMKTCLKHKNNFREEADKLVPSLQKVVDNFRNDAGGPPLPMHWIKAGVTKSTVHKYPFGISLRHSSSLFQRIQARMKQVMPEIEIADITMNTNYPLFTNYHFDRRKVATTLMGNTPKDEEEACKGSNETWLWHGFGLKSPCDASIDQIRNDLCSEGWHHAHSNADFNHFGCGHYFAFDPRKAHMYTKAKSDGTRTMLLSRVVRGNSYEKTILIDPSVHKNLRIGNHFLTKQNDPNGEIMRDLLRKPEHKKPPEGYHSVLGIVSPRISGRPKTKTEVVIYDDYRAFPAFSVTYKYEVGSAVRKNWQLMTDDDPDSIWVL